MPATHSLRGRDRLQSIKFSASKREADIRFLLAREEKTRQEISKLKERFPSPKRAARPDTGNSDGIDDEVPETAPNPCSSLLSGWQVRWNRRAELADEIDDLRSQFDKYERELDSVVKDIDYILRLLEERQKILEGALEALKGCKESGGTCILEEQDVAAAESRIAAFRRLLDRNLDEQRELINCLEFIDGLIAEVVEQYNRETEYMRDIEGEMAEANCGAPYPEPPKDPFDPFDPSDPLSPFFPFSEGDHSHQSLDKKKAPKPSPKRVSKAKQVKKKARK